jgi:hypothetical protein
VSGQGTRRTISGRLATTPGVWRFRWRGDRTGHSLSVEGGRSQPEEGSPDAAEHTADPAPLLAQHPLPCPTALPVARTGRSGTSPSLPWGSCSPSAVTPHPGPGHPGLGDPGLELGVPAVQHPARRPGRPQPAPVPGDARTGATHGVIGGRGGRGAAPPPEPDAAGPRLAPPSPHAPPSGAASTAPRVGGTGLAPAPEPMRRPSGLPPLLGARPATPGRALVRPVAQNGRGSGPRGAGLATGRTGCGGPTRPGRAGREGCCRQRHRGQARAAGTGRAARPLPRTPLA